MRVIVCGSRHGHPRAELILDQWLSEPRTSMVQVITGGAKGVDTQAAEWAGRNGLMSVVVPAPWEVHGRAAGPIRNSWMLLLNPDLVIAFPGGKGTANMVGQALSHSVEVREVLDDE